MIPANPINNFAILCRDCSMYRDDFIRLLLTIRFASLYTAFFTICMQANETPSIIHMEIWQSNGIMQMNTHTVILLLFAFFSLLILRNAHCASKNHLANCMPLNILIKNMICLNIHCRTWKNNSHFQVKTVKEIKRSLDKKKTNFIWDFSNRNANINWFFPPRGKIK